MLRTYFIKKPIHIFPLIILSILFLAACGNRDQLDSKTDKPADVNDDFRSDTPSIIGSTGRPQLIELYADW